MEKAELRERITACLDRMGRYHVLLLSAFGLFNVSTGISHASTLFHSYTPRFYCRASEADEVNNAAGWGVCLTNSTCYFDQNDKYESLVTDYDLICSRRYLAALTSTVYFVGVTLGAVFFGPISDQFGRKIVIFVCNISYFVLGCLIAIESVTVSIKVFIALRLIQGFFIQGMQSTAFTALIELSPPRFRTALGCIWDVQWSFALICLGILSKYVLDWRTLQLYLLIPSGLGMFAIFLLPESIHWLWTKNSFTKVVKIYTKLAKSSKNHKFLEEELLFQKDKNWPEIERKYKSVTESEKNPKTQMVLQNMLKNTILRKHIIVMGYFWFVGTLSYYALIYFMPNLSGDRHLNFIASAVIEMFAYILMYFSMKRFGRRFPLFGYTLFNGLLCLTFSCLTLIKGDASEVGENEVDTTKTVLILIARGLAATGFYGMYVFTGELFPTVCRGSTLGYCGFWSRIGSLSAPQLISLAELVAPWLPVALMGFGLIAAALPILLLPETLHIHIPNTFEDVQNLWGAKLKRRYFDESL